MSEDSREIARPQHEALLKNQEHILINQKQIKRFFNLLATVRRTAKTIAADADVVPKPKAAPRKRTPKVISAE